MKLNIGCGYQYKSGYINIDAYNKSVADKTDNVEKLKYKSNSVQHIQAKQFIEHLGFFKTIYSLAEWYRILKPRGTIILETPDLETSFQQFLKGDFEVKRNIITWIYGHESKGMVHIFCFPKDLLELILQKTGFIITKKELFGKKGNQPTIRIKCEKPKDYKKYQAISYFRNKILKQKIVNFENIYTTIEQEKLIDFFINQTEKINKKNQIKILDEITIKGAIHSPVITKKLIEELIEFKIINKDKTKKYLQTLNFLINIDYPSLLLYLLRQTDVIPGNQNKIYQSIELIGKKSINKLLNSSEKQKIKKFFLETNKNKKSETIDFFSEETIQRKADKIFWIAIKQFHEKNYKKANTLLKESIRIYRNNLFYFWNQSRLYRLLKNKNLAEQNYKKSLDLINKLEHPKKQELKKKISKEISNKSKEYTKPILFYEVIDD